LNLRGLLDSLCINHYEESTMIYGIWDPLKDEPGPHNDRSRMEWWPSMAAAHRSMRARLYPGGATTAVDAARYVHREDRLDAQWGGSTDQSCIYLYETPDSDQPNALVEFGPRGGIQVHPMTGEVPRTVALAITCEDRPVHCWEVVVHPWHLDRQGPDEGARWARWLVPATRRGLRLMEFPPLDPFHVVATDPATGEQLATLNAA
jgi:hypothetical protein